MSNRRTLKLTTKILDPASLLFGERLSGRITYEEQIIEASFLAQTSDPEIPSYYFQSPFDSPFTIRMKDRKTIPLADIISWTRHLLEKRVIHDKSVEEVMPGCFRCCFKASMILIKDEGA